MASIFCGESAEKTREKRVGEKVGEKLTQNQEKILTIIRKDPYASAQTLSETVGTSTRKIEKNIAKLKKRVFLKRIGPDKGGRWEVHDAS